MQMLYQIEVHTPRERMSGWGFSIHLWEAWKEAVARTDFHQHKVNKIVERMGRGWLDSCGYDSIFDPDNCGFDKNRSVEPGPNARPMYEPNLSLRVSWGEWGPEHITVPGNACGLDLDDGMFGSGQKSLTPHNVDCMQQAYLLKLVFSWFGNAIILNERSLELDS